MHSIIPFHKQTAYIKVSEYSIKCRSRGHTYSFHTNRNEQFVRWLIFNQAVSIVLLRRLIERVQMNRVESNQFENGFDFDIACAVKADDLFTVWTLDVIATKQHKQKVIFDSSGNMFCLCIKPSRCQNGKLIFTKTLTSCERRGKKKNNKMYRTAWFVSLYIYIYIFQQIYDRVYWWKTQAKIYFE